MPKIYCGIDPGFKTGGVAFVSDDWAEVHDLPLWDHGGLRCYAFKELLDSLPVSSVVIEKQGARPGQGVSSVFNLGMSYGQILGCLSTLELKHVMVSPHMWKKHMKLGKEKDHARQLAMQLFPKLNDDLQRKKDEHRAEALLLAEYLRDTDQ